MAEHVPAPAPEIIMDANGVYWRRYPDSLSMVPTSDDNEPLAEPLVVYRPEGELHAEVERLRDGLADLADAHHRTLTGSLGHNPQNLDWRDCQCVTCCRTAALLEGRETGPERAWRIAERAEAEVERLRFEVEQLRAENERLRNHASIYEEARAALRAAVEAITTSESEASHG